MEVPVEIVGGITAILGAVAFAIRRRFLNQASTGDEMSATTLHGIRVILNELRDAEGGNHCLWDKGGLPPALEARLTQLLLELEILVKGGRSK